MNVVPGLFATSKRVTATVNSFQKRFKVKQKWASKKKSKTPEELALEHFDLHYKPVYGSLWPSMRIALLSRQKYCAVINNFTFDQQEVILELAELGASNFISIAKDTSTTDRYSLMKKNNVQKTGHHKKESKLGEGIQEEIKGRELDTDFLQLNSAPNTNLFEFMPVKRVLSDKEQMTLDEYEQNIHRPAVLPVNIIPHGPLHFPPTLQPFAVGRGDITAFEPAGRDSSGKLTYYLMDAGSVLPVIALDLKPGCEVLDLCSAPGGKSYAILQTMLAEKLTCVDNSYSRINRLKDVMRLFLPQSYIEKKTIDILKSNGVAFCAALTEQFDRVLVDVPCFADRHALQADEEDGCIFRPGRIKERLDIQNSQQHLLFAGIKSCKPGGVIVYSTCTLSMPQNDGTVQAVLERIRQETDLDVAVEDTGIIADHFRNTFNFYGICRYGQLVVPNLTANFGPTYFCKLRRLK